MKLYTPISISCDLSECALEEVFKSIKSDNCSLIVGTEGLRAARVLKSKFKQLKWIWVNPEWKDEWAVSSQYLSVFSEGA